MSLTIVEGFDQYGLDETKLLEGNWAEIFGWQLTQDPTQVRTGTTALIAKGQFFRNIARRVFPVQNNYAVMGFAFRNVDTLPVAENRQTLVTFMDANNEFQCDLRVLTTGQLQVTSGSTAIHSLLPLVQVEAFHSIELKVSIDATTGFFEVRFDGVEVVWDGANTNIDTDPSGFGSMSQFNFGKRINHAAPEEPEWSLDDIWVLDNTGPINNDWIGDKQAFFSVPDADTATADWGIIGGGAGYESIDNIPSDGDTTYIEADVINDISIFGMSDIDLDIVNIVGVQVASVVRKTDSGATQFQASLISGASTTAGADRVITESYNTWNDVIENNPDGDVPWTPTTWNAAQYKAERTS